MLLVQSGGAYLYSYRPKTDGSTYGNVYFFSIFPQSIMLRWQPPPLNSQNGEIVNYRIKYRKGSRRSENSDSTSGTQLFKLISGMATDSVVSSQLITRV